MRSFKPAPHKFKVGDKVLCVDGLADMMGENELTPGSVHTVLKLDILDSSIEIDNNYHPLGYSFVEDRFIKIDGYSKLFRIIWE